MPSGYGVRRRRRRAAYGRGIGDFFKKIGGGIASGWNKLRDGKYISRGLATAAQLGSAFNPALAAKAGAAANIAGAAGFGRRRRKTVRKPAGGRRIGNHAMIY